MVVPALYAGLLDDAALFPPGDAPMPRALDEHRQHRSAWYAPLIGPFLCPVSEVAELLTTLPADDRLGLSLVVDADADAAHHALRRLAADERVVLVAVEASHERLGEDAATVGTNLARLPGATGFLEVPRTGFEAGLDLVAAEKWPAAKYRTGGTSAAAYPDETELAAFLVAAVSRDVPFKLTAGLHHAVRSTAEGTGFEQHGLLNVLVATRVAQQEGSTEEVTAVLAERRQAALVAFVRDWDEAAGADVRRLLRSVGCCGVTEPVEDLVALGLLEAQR